MACSINGVVLVYISLMPVVANVDVTTDGSLYASYYNEGNFSVFYNDSFVGLDFNDTGFNYNDWYTGFDYNGSYTGFDSNDSYTGFDYNDSFTGFDYNGSYTGFDYNDSYTGFDYNDSYTGFDYNDSFTRFDNNETENGHTTGDNATASGDNIEYLTQDTEVPEDIVYNDENYYPDYRNGSSNETSLYNTRRLYEDRFFSYDVRVRPTKNQSLAMSVAADFVPKYITDFDVTQQVFRIMGYFRFTWTDVQLSWKPRDYGLVDTLRVPTTDIWTPNIIIQKVSERKQTQRDYKFVVYHT